MKSDYKANNLLREISIMVEGDNKFPAFLYEIIRDHITTGIVEKLVSGLELDDNDTFLYTNGWLAEYVKGLLIRLTNNAD